MRRCFSSRYLLSEPIDRIDLAAAIARSPPFIDADVGASGEPGVQHEDAPESGRPRETLLQRRVVVQPESLTKPVNRVLPAVALDSRGHPLAHLVVTTSRHLFSVHPSKRHFQLGNSMHGNNSIIVPLAITINLLHCYNKSTERLLTVQGVLGIVQVPSEFIPSSIS